MEENNLSEECLAVLNIHIGADNAISNFELAEKLGISMREVRSLVRNLRCDGYHVCSSRGGKGGYFLAETDEEKIECEEEFRKQMISSIITYTNLKRMTFRELSQQLKLDLEEEVTA